jgi:hypothetical protein
VVADDGPGMSRAQQETAVRRFASNTSGGTLDLPAAPAGRSSWRPTGPAGKATIPYQF